MLCDNQTFQEAADSGGSSVAHEKINTLLMKHMHQWKSKQVQKSSSFNSQLMSCKYSHYNGWCFQGATKQGRTRLGRTCCSMANCEQALVQLCFQFFFLLVTAREREGEGERGVGGMQHGPQAGLEPAMGGTSLWWYVLFVSFTWIPMSIKWLLHGIVQMSINCYKEVIKQNPKHKGTMTQHISALSVTLFYQSP